MGQWWQNEQIQIVLNKYRELSLREKRIMLLSIHVLIAGFFLMGFLEPLWNSSLAHRQQAQIIEGKATRMESYLERLLDTSVIDPDLPIKEEIANLEQQKKDINERIYLVANTLVTPKQMPEMLGNILTEKDNMKIQNLHNRPSENIVFENHFSDVQLFKHGVSLEITTDYPSLVDYLNALDAMPWKLYWENLDFEVHNYPKGKLNIDIYTLSTTEEILSD